MLFRQYVGEVLFLSNCKLDVDVFFEFLNIHHPKIKF